MPDAHNGNADIADDAINGHYHRMRNDGGKVISQHSVLRDLFPFYTLDQLLVGAVLTAMAYGLLVFLEEPAAPLITASAFAGMALVGWTTRPAILFVEERQVPLLISTLRSVEYRYVPERDHWVPSLPRWLRWKFNFVKFVGDDHRVRVAGPTNVLRFLRAQLR